MNWNLDEILTALLDVECSTECKLSDNKSDVISGIFTDSRKTVPGGLFVPLVGEKFDGHNYVKDVLEKGASFALWSKDRLPEDLDPCKIIRVKDTLRAYQLLGKAHLKRLNIPVIAVTGSVGKTTTKDLLLCMLKTKYNVHATPLNHNNEVGVPNTLLELTKDHHIAVIELGMRGLGQIASLAGLLEPKVGIITTIGESHLEILGSREAICQAKSELLEYISPNGVAVLPKDSPFFDKMHSLAHSKTVSFGSNGSQGDYTAQINGVVINSQDGVLKAGQNITVTCPKGKYDLFLPMLGSHNAINLTGALAAADVFGIEPDQVKEALALFKPTGGRVEIELLSQDTVLIDDAYNAAPASCKGALEVLDKTCEKLTEETGKQCRKVAVLGDMLELGPESPKFHAQTAQMCKDTNVDVLLAVGPLSENTAIEGALLNIPQVFWLEDKNEAWQVLEGILLPGDLVLVKASHSMGLDYVSAKMREKFKK